MISRFKPARNRGCLFYASKIMNNELKEGLSDNEDVRVHGTMATRTALNWLILVRCVSISIISGSVLFLPRIILRGEACCNSTRQHASHAAVPRQAYFETSRVDHARKHPWNFHRNIGEPRYCFNPDNCDSWFG